MTLNAIFEHLSVGGVLSVVVVLSYIIEISPIKINPIQALGKLMNKPVLDRLDKTDAHVDLIEGKLDGHIVSSLRSKILLFMDDIVERNQLKTRSQWAEILKACAMYEDYIEENHLINGDATEAIDFLHAEYQECLKTGKFHNLQTRK